MTKTDKRLQFVFALLFIGSFFLDDQVVKILPTWSDPKVGLLSYVIGIFWMGSLILDRMRDLENKHRVLEDRIDRHKNKIRALEDELAGR